MNLYGIILNAVKEAIITALTRVPRDVYEALLSAIDRERNERAKRILSTIIESIRIAIKEQVPLCQDTGVPVFYVEVGMDFPLKIEIRDILIKAVREITYEGLMRPNAVHPFTNKNSGDNTGILFPLINIDLVPGNHIAITFLAKGGGSEYVSKLFMAPPSQGREYIKKYVLESVLEAGPKPCPPVILSIGIGGTADMAMNISRKNMIKRRIGLRHKEEDIAKIEDELLKDVNKLGIGPAGLGGDITALDVWIDYGYRHPATFAIALTFSCWCLRRAHIEIDRDGNIEYDPNDFWSL
ncbi:MAG TPA: fumarate hydratase [Desulfurococcaceae archaeon]|nr:fumarate hydratase [Desulfurococcaceae archaeon]